MVETVANTAETPTVGSYTRQALHIVDRVEREIAQNELNFGRERLLQTVNDFGTESYATHIDYYRRVIRETTWPNGKWVGGMHSDFLRGFEYSSLGYVWTGFEALRFFAFPNKLSIEQVYEDALIAESLRGQFGKSSPDGLDRRLEELEERFLENYGTEDELVLLCTPIAPIRTVERSLIEDFVGFRTIFPFPPTIDQILDVSESNETSVWQFLRRYVKWNVSALEPFYHEVPNADDPAPSSARDETTIARRERQLALLPEAALILVDEIMSLNVLNLVLEPAFSFKGCVGFPLGMVFRSVDHVEKRPALDQMTILLGKMNLFTLAQQRSGYEK